MTNCHKSNETATLVMKPVLWYIDVLSHPADGGLLRKSNSLQWPVDSKTSIINSTDQDLLGRGEGAV